ncbi:MAG TPA: hypothetical protein VMT34_05660 [Aggregatilineales bacterium]|nr:hypothetical protein [Aggregatilineales bacterium]
MNLRSLFQNRRRALIVIAAALLALLIGLALDLHFYGLAWHLFYGVTGEEAPFKQIYGSVSYLGNVTRREPVTASDAPIPVDLKPANLLGVNTFLEDEPEVAKRERQMQMIADAGFGWIRQQFRWDDIEISGRGDFTDRRNGSAISAWEKYDNIVSLAEKYHVGIIVRLNSPPAWSQPPGSNPGFTPPANYDDFAAYAGTVAARYKGRVRFYQVWNEPNIYPEWGELAINPEAYTDLLCRASRAIKKADGSAIVIAGALAPTIDLGARNLSDTIFLQRMYDAGAGRCFDILSAQGYGLFSGPTDRRMRITTINYSHVLWLRDLMIANGDAARPIWISEMGWNPVPSDGDIANREAYGQVTDDQAAQDAVEAFDRAHKEWPFVGVISYWYFKRPDDHEKNQSFYYFRLVDPDFTPRPAYNAIKAYAQGASH